MDRSIEIEINIDTDIQQLEGHHTVDGCKILHQLISGFIPFWRFQPSQLGGLSNFAGPSTLWPPFQTSPNPPPFQTARELTWQLWSWYPFALLVTIWGRLWSEIQCLFFQVAEDANNNNNNSSSNNNNAKCQMPIAILFIPFWGPRSPSLVVLSLCQWNCETS